MVSSIFLLFADDTLYFCGMDRGQVQFLRAFLLHFEAVSRLKLNLVKFEMVPMGFVSNIISLKKYFGMRGISFTFQMAWSHLGASYKAKTIWKWVIEKIERILARWKRIYLSKGGRVTLIKSTLSSLPTYWLSLFPIPTGVVN